MNKAMTHAHLFRLVLAGKSGVGKSCYLERLVDRVPPTSRHGTIGVDFSTATVVHAGEAIKLHCWDTAGQANYRKIVRAYFRAAHGVLLFYDVTDRASFAELVTWLAEIDAAQGSSARPPILIVGTKTDLVEERAVSLSEAVAFAMREGCMHEEVSAQADKNVGAPVTRLTAAMYAELPVHPQTPSGAARSLLPKGSRSTTPHDSAGRCCCTTM